LPRASTGPQSIGGRARSITAHIDRFYWKVRLHASWAPVESGAMSVDSAPPSACGFSAPAATRHPPPVQPLPLGFSELGGAGDLDRFLPDSDFVVICCQWTRETTRLFDKARFDAMKAGSVLINVARGEIVDEEALTDALQCDHLRGAALDVYVGEFEHMPMSRLWSDPRVLITPHISSSSDQDRHGAINLFCENLRAYLDGEPLRKRHRLGTGLLARRQDMWCTVGERDACRCRCARCRRRRHKRRCQSEKRTFPRLHESFPV
jgi:hypothetical protein